MTKRKNDKIGLPFAPGNRDFLRTGGMNGNRSQKGFTLIEVIVTLVLVAILAATGGMAIVQAVKGYMAVKQNSATTQKYQMAMSRINREITEMINVPSAATNTVLPITGISNCSGTDCVRTIGLYNGAIVMTFGSGNTTWANGDILIDNVTSFNITYYQGTNTSPTWSTGHDQDLSGVKISMTIRSPSGVSVASTTPEYISPRNNGNLGGASPPETVTSPPAGWGCFVATAAFGNPAHPMVQVLREFRDRHLINWPGGKWLIHQYGTYGPAAADMIRNRPMAMFIGRCLLAPFVALSFCMMYAPLAIPFILAVSLVFTTAFFSALRRKRLTERLVFLESRGSVLIGLIITMVIMAMLAAAMLPIFSASYMNQVYADQARKAYYLAESGFRYAAYNYRNADTDLNKDAALFNSHNRTFNISGNAGSFTTAVYPLWFVTSANTSAGATTLATATVTGTIPDEFSGSSFSGYIQVRNYSSSNPAVIGNCSFSSFSVSGSTITFSGLSPALAATTAPVVIVPAARTTASSQSLSKGGNLTLTSTGVGALPLVNGSFTLTDSSGADIKNGWAFSYKWRIGNTLYSISLSDITKNTGWTSAVTVPASSNVILCKFLRLTSTGNVGSISRTVKYSVPIGWMGGGTFQKKHYYDNMSTGTNWITDSDKKMGSQTFGPSAMTVTGMVDPTGGGFTGWLAGLLGWSCGDKWNIIQWNWINTDTNLAQAWTDAHGFLTYDVQVKVSAPSQQYFFAGMNFRGRANSDDSDFFTYGVSFIKAKQSCEYVAWGCPGTFGPWQWDVSSDQCSSLIPDPLYSSAQYDYSSYSSFWGTGTVYRYSSPAIVLWRRNSSGFQWLAYRKLVTNDRIVTLSGSSYRLVDNSTLLVRLSEGFSLTFTGGNTGTPIKEGDIITNSTGTKSARVVMTPILSSGTWTSGSPASGTLVLANIYPSDLTSNFSSSEVLYVNGVQRATAGTFTAIKKNYIRVYFSGTAAQGTANSSELDPTSSTPNRLANPLGSANWPPDPLPDLNSSNDYFTLVQWDGLNGVTASSIVEPSGTTATNAIIVTTDLTSPSPSCMTTDPFSCTGYNFTGPDGTSAGDSIGLVTAYSTGTSVSYDDFAAQLDLNTGIGFLTPVQQ